MQYIKFRYSKTPTEISNRKAVVLTEPSNNYFTLDITEFNDEELDELEAGLAKYQEQLDEVFAARTEWLRNAGFNSYYRSFNKDKMNMAV